MQIQPQTVQNIIQIYYLLIIIAFRLKYGLVVRLYVCRIPSVNFVVYKLNKKSTFKHYRQPAHRPLYTKYFAKREHGPLVGGHFNNKSIHSKSIMILLLRL